MLALPELNHKKQLDLTLFSAKSFPVVTIALEDAAQLLSLWFYLQPLLDAVLIITLGHVSALLRCMKMGLLH